MVKMFLTYFSGMNIYMYLHCYVINQTRTDGYRKGGGALNVKDIQFDRP